MITQQAPINPRPLPDTTLKFTFSNVAFNVVFVFGVAIVSFWARSLWESTHLYRSDCVSRPTAECIEDLRRAASWASPGNEAARDALEDLKTISNGGSTFKESALEGAERSKATTRSIFDRYSPKLKSDLNPGYAVAAFIFFIGWIWCGFLIVWKGFRADGGPNYSQVGKYAVLAALFAVVWLAALARA